MIERNSTKTWIIFAGSVLVAPLAAFFRPPQHVYWSLVLDPHQFGVTTRQVWAYVGLASIPPILGVIIGTFGLASYRAWIRLAVSCSFNVLWIMLVIGMAGD